MQQVGRLRDPDLLKFLSQYVSDTKSLSDASIMTGMVYETVIISVNPIRYKNRKDMYKQIDSLLHLIGDRPIIYLDTYGSHYADFYMYEKKVLKNYLNDRVKNLQTLEIPFLKRENSFINKLSPAPSQYNIVYTFSDLAKSSLENLHIERYYIHLNYYTYKILKFLQSFFWCNRRHTRFSSLCFKIIELPIRKIFKLPTSLCFSSLMSKNL